MVQISKHVFSVESWQLIWAKVVTLIHQSPSRDTTNTLLQGLLTPTEQIIVAKRLLASLLLASDWNPYEVARLVKLSTATVYKLKNQLESDSHYAKEIRKALPQPIPYKDIYQQATSLAEVADELFVNSATLSRVLYSQIN